MNEAIVSGVELVSFQAWWFVGAGFILGFAASTLWEWLYYRAKRRAHLSQGSSITPALPPANSRLTGNDDGGEGQSTSPWAVSYRSSGIYLESEQLAPSVSTTTMQALSPAPAANTPTTEQPSTSTPPADGNVPRLNPATLVALQTAVAQTPIAQAPNRHAAGVQPFAVQGAANAKVYDTPTLVSPAPATPERAEINQVGLPAVAFNAQDLRADSAAPGPLTASTSPATQPATPLALSGQTVGLPGVEVDRHDHPDDLALIKGVGEAYKRRLYGAGIYTWRQVAESDTETLRRITRAKPNANINAWRQDARDLAEKYQRWETTFRGPLDELTRIDGIGAITADILYKAGICTYDQLAAAMPDELAKIVPAPTVGDEIDFDGWINAAVRLANAKRRNQGLIA